MRQLPSGGLQIDLSGRCRMHSGTNPGAPKGNCNAWKQGGYSAAVLAMAAALQW